MELGTKILIFIFSIPTIAGFVIGFKEWIRDRKNAKVEEVKPMSPDQFKRHAIKSQTKISKPVLIEEAEVVPTIKGSPTAGYKLYMDKKKKGIINKDVTYQQWNKARIKPDQDDIELEIGESSIPVLSSN